MRYGLKPRISYCYVDNRFILLDLNRNAYLMLPSHVGLAFGNLVNGSEVSDKDIEILNALVSEGVLVVEDDQYARVLGEEVIDTPVSGVPWTRSDKLHLARVLGASVRICITRMRIRIFSLSKSILRVRRRKHHVLNHCVGQDIDLMKRVAADFRDAGLFISDKDKCLPRSIALIETLAKWGQFPKLILGVKARPFAAHAWVQHEGTVLNDTVDNVLPYTPILVV